MAKQSSPQSQPGLLRDQIRARHAYRCVREIAESNNEKLRSRYGIAVMNLGTNIRRLGLAGAVSKLEYDAKDAGPRSLLEHLAKAEVSGLGRTEASKFPDAVRNLDARKYMLAARDLLQIATWFKRAAQALLPGTDEPADAKE